IRYCSPGLPLALFHLLRGQRLRRILAPTQERLMRRGIVSKTVTHLAQRLHQALQVAQRLDTQGGVNQVARLQETHPGGEQLEERCCMVIHLVEELEQAAQEAVQALVVRDELVGVLLKLWFGRQTAPVPA